MGFVKGWVFDDFASINNVFPCYRDITIISSELVTTVPPHVTSGKSVDIFRMYFDITEQAGKQFYLNFYGLFKDYDRNFLHISSLQGSGYQLGIRLNTNGYIELWSGYSVSILSTSNVPFDLNKFYLIQIEAFVSNTGFVRVSIDGNVILNYTGDTQYLSFNSARYVELESFVMYGFFVNNNDVVANEPVMNNSLIPGGLNFLLLKPNVDGADTWHKSVGVDAFALLNTPLGPPDDSTYVYGDISTEVGLVNTVGFENTTFPLNDISCVSFYERITYLTNQFDFWTNTVFNASSMQYTSDDIDNLVRTTTI